jgi:beta-lactamase regulating signal transducer with metallopeptidase domain
MKELGFALSGLVTQVTLAMLPAIALHLLASRRGPVAGSWMAAASLAMIVGISVMALVPLPKIMGEPATFATASEYRRGTIPAALPDIGDRKEAAVGSLESVRFLTLTQARSIWRRVGSRLVLIPNPWMRWAGIAALVALAGMGIGLFRLLLGLWAVHVCRRKGTRIDDSDATHLLRSLMTAMHYDAPVELRELSDLDTPATAGWRRPMVLLPMNWRSWSQSDLRAVLAHELAHIQRSDYVVGLMARLAVALHFYHPLVRWMAGRLLSQQELAADAVGAKFAGGRGPYLTVLSRMALRQDRETFWGPARAFSPACGTLIRRIRMLRNHEESADRGWAPVRRVLAVVLLAGIAMGVWTLPPPVQGGNGEKSADVAKETQRAPASRSDTPAFDLSYVPDDAMGVVAVHPAATFRRQGMAKYAGQLNALTSMQGLDKALGIPISKCPLKVEQIEQITAVVTLGHSVHQGKETGKLMIGSPAIRTIEPFDWLKLVRSWWSDAVQMKEGDKVYYKIHCPVLGPNPCFYIPDNRTVVCGEEANILRLIRRQAPPAPDFARGADWKTVEHCLLTVILDNHDGRISRQSKEVPEDDEEAQVKEFLELSDRWVLGLADTDDFLVRFVATCHDERSTQTLGKLVTKLRDSYLKDFQEPHKDAIPDHLRLQAQLDQIMKGFQIQAGQTYVSAELGGGVKLADLLPLIAKNGL